MWGYTALRSYRRAISKLTTVLLNIPESSNLSRVWQHYLHFQCYLHPCFLHILWYTVLSVGELCLQNWLFKSHYDGIRKPQVWEIMQPNKKKFWILNSPVVSMSLSLPNVISQDTTLFEQGKIPPRNWMGGQHTRMEIMQADVLLILLFPSTGLSHHPQPIQEKCLYC